MKNIVDIAGVATFFVLLLLSCYLPGMVPGTLKNCTKPCKENLVEIANAIETFAKDHDSTIPERLEELTPGYIRVLPTCPCAGKMTYCYVRSDNNEVYTLYCRGKNHKADRPKGWVNYPQYDCVSGLLEGKK